VVPDARQDERTRFHTKGDARARSFIALPVSVPVGIAALIMSRNEEHWPDAEELLLLETIARAAGLALQAQLSAEHFIGGDQESVGEWLESQAGGSLRGAEREQALLAAQIRHRVRNVLSLVRSTARLQASARGVLGFAFDDLMTDALLLSATSARQEAAMLESPATGAPFRDRTELSGRAILVVEDDYFIAEELCRTLHDQGALVIGPAVDAPEARNLMDRQLLDCAVLDVNLHGEHVFALAHELRARSVPVIFATGYDREFLPDVFRDSGYLQKPIEASALISAVRSNLREFPSRHN
jgi:CheY-like chemotaxis protein